MLALNPWLLLAAGLALAGAVGGAYVKGRADGRAVEIAQRVTLEEVARVARDAAMEGAAEKIAEITINHTTIRQKAEVVTRENKIYVECINQPEMIKLLDQARANKSETLGE
jgi:shikimate 5-dehydrogenase